MLGKRGAIVKVKVIRNYDLGEYQSKQVHDGGIRMVGTERRRRKQKQREGETGRKGGGRRKEVKKAVEERRRKGKQWKGNSFPLAGETCELVL